MLDQIISRLYVGTLSATGLVEELLRLAVAVHVMLPRGAPLASDAAEPQPRTLTVSAPSTLRE